MITIKRIKQAVCKLYSPKDVEIGVIDDIISLNDVRIQIAQQGLEGYYLIWEDQKIPILPNGDVTKWPLLFYDDQQHQFYVLVSIRKGHNYEYRFQ